MADTPLRTVAWAVAAALGVEGAFIVGSTTLEAVVIFGHPGLLEDPTGPGALWLGAFALAELGLVLSTVGAIPVWAWWHRDAARAAGEASLADPPGWHVGWWFVPGANLWRPWQATRDLFRAARERGGDPDDLSEAAASALFVAWWATWLLGWPVDELSTVMDDPRVGAGFGVAGATLRLASIGLYLRVVWAITDRLERSAPPTPAPTA